MSLPPPPPAAGDPVTPEDSLGSVTPGDWATGPPSQAQPLLRQEAKGEAEEGEETGVQGAWGKGTAEQRRRGWGEAAEAPAAEEGQVEAGGAAGSASPAGGAGGGPEGWRRLLAWLRRRQPQCCPCAAPLPRSAAHCCHGGTKMAALAYNLGKREINHYFSVRSAKVLALVAVLLLAVCHLASRRYRGERALPLPGPAGAGGGDAEAGGRPLARHTPTLTRPPAGAPSGRGRRSPRVPPGGPGGGPGAPDRRADPSSGGRGSRARGPGHRPPTRTASRRCWRRGRPPGPGPAGSGGPGSCAGWAGGHAAGPGLACRRRAGGPRGPAQGAWRPRPPATGAPRLQVGSPNSAP